MTHNRHPNILLDSFDDDPEEITLEEVLHLAVQNSQAIQELRAQVDALQEAAKRTVKQPRELHEGTRFIYTQAMRDLEQDTVTNSPSPGQRATIKHRTFGKLYVELDDGRTWYLTPEQQTLIQVIP